MLWEVGKRKAPLHVLIIEVLARKRFVVGEPNPQSIIEDFSMLYMRIKWTHTSFVVKADARCHKIVLGVCYKCFFLKINVAYVLLNCNRLVCILLKNHKPDVARFSEREIFTCFHNVANTWLFYFNSLYFYCNNWCFLLQINLQQNKLLVKHFFIAASTFFCNRLCFCSNNWYFLLQINLQKKIVG
jgi:hypothetical protein